MIAGRFNGQDVFANCYPQSGISEMFHKAFPNFKFSSHDKELHAGAWFQVEAEKNYEMQVIVNEAYGRSSGYVLMLQDQNPVTPYEKVTDPL